MNMNIKQTNIQAFLWVFLWASLEIIWNPLCVLNYNPYFTSPYLIQHPQLTSHFFFIQMVLSNYLLYKKNISGEGPMHVLGWSQKEIQVGAESSSEKKDLGVLVDEFDMIWQCTFATHQAMHIWNCRKRSVIRRLRDIILFHCSAGLLCLHLGPPT